MQGKNSLLLFIFPTVIFPNTYRFTQDNKINVNGFVEYSLNGKNLIGSNIYNIINYKNLASYSLNKIIFDSNNNSHNINQERRCKGEKRIN